MRNYLELNFDYAKYHDNLVSFVESARHTIREPYDSLDLVLFKQTNPELNQFLEEFSGSELERIIIFSFNGTFGIHRDIGPRVCRLNWPIINSNSAETVFYQLKPDAVSKKFEGIDFYNESDTVIVDRYILHQPTIMNTDTVHNVLPIAKAPLPRIVVSFNFVDDSILAKML
jgi:hypothetical protein